MESDGTRKILEALERQGRENAERDAALRAEIADRDAALRTVIADRDAAGTREHAELGKEFAQLRLEQRKARAEFAEGLDRLSRTLLGGGLALAALFVATTSLIWAMQENRGAPAAMQPPVVYFLPGPVHAGQGEGGTAVPTLP